MSARQVAIFIALSVALFTTGGAFTGLKLNYLYKDILHLSAGGTATLQILTGIPGYLRPFMGSGMDLFALFGYHRRSYYAASWIVYALAWLAFALVPVHEYRYWGVVLLVSITVVGLNLVYVVMDSIMVAVGNLDGTVGRFQAIQQGLPLVLSFAFTSALSGYVAEHWSYQVCFFAAAAVAIAGAFLTLLVRENRVSQQTSIPAEIADRKSERKENRRSQREQLGKALSTPGLWICVLYIFYLSLTPGSSTAQFYYQVNVLHFSPQFIGNLGISAAAGSTVGGTLFLFVSRRMSNRWIVWGAFIGDLLGYPILLFYRSPISAEIITFFVYFCAAVNVLCILTLAAKACPPGIEASIYALFAAAINLAGTLSLKIGSDIYDYYGPAHHYTTTHGWNVLLWSGTGLTLLGAVIIPFLPQWTRESHNVSVDAAMSSSN